jgi:hypothetical protein
LIEAVDLIRVCFIQAGCKKAGKKAKMMPTFNAMRHPVLHLKRHALNQVEPASAQAAFLGFEADETDQHEAIVRHRIYQTGGLYWKGLLDGNSF